MITKTAYNLGEMAPVILVYAEKAASAKKINNKVLKRDTDLNRKDN